MIFIINFIKMIKTLNKDEKNYSWIGFGNEFCWLVFS